MGEENSIFFDLPKSIQALNFKMKLVAGLKTPAVPPTLSFL